MNSVLLLFRFDLIFLILDPQDEMFDRRLANHLVSLYYTTEEEIEEEEMVSNIQMNLANLCS